MEDLAYRRLLDLYYLQEKPIAGTVQEIAREIGLNECSTDVEYVLNKYFTHDVEGYVNKRADESIRAYKDKQKKASKAGKASAQARKHKASEQTFNGRSTDVQPTNNHKPITNNQLTPPNPPRGERNSKRFKPPTVEEVREYCTVRANNVDPQTFVDFYTGKGWMVGKNKMKDWQAAVRTWEKKRDGNTQGNSRSTEQPRRLSPHERVRAAAERHAREQQGEAVPPVGSNVYDVE